MDHKKLARFLCALVRAEFTESELAEIRARNARPEYVGACATHDFCDANALLFGAWCAIAFEAPDFTDGTTLDACNSAWAAARESGYTL